MSSETWVTTDQNLLQTAMDRLMRRAARYSRVRVSHDLVDRLVAATRRGESGCPRECVGARRHVDDREAAELHLALGVRNVSHGTVGGHHGEHLVGVEPAAEYPYSRPLGVADHRVRIRRDSG